MNPINVFLILLIILFSILIGLTIHELGHFIFAKIFKVNVKEFSIGFGPVIWSWYTKSKLLKISIRLLPIGAYVMMDSKALRKSYLDFPNLKNYHFYLYPKPYKTFLFDELNLWKKIIIIFAGISFNFLFFFIFWGIWSFINPNLFLQLNKFIENFFIGIGKSFVLYNLWSGQNSSSQEVPSILNSIPNGDFLLRYLISINLGIGLLNLIPIPPLDGWKFISLFIEKILKKDLPNKIQTFLSLFGVIVLLWITIGSIINSFV
ncbi:site-2 protease family protein [Mycoplasmoides alvi]|uniref:site-2 protease family protein n=1 Tax=Mycoplasmoides alvi TaxID=78580 RepID=UPI00051C0867|nr:site-2 protease family protein [Mycoplasmoides alvi]